MNPVAVENAIHDMRVALFRCGYRHRVAVKPDGKSSVSFVHEACGEDAGQHPIAHDLACRVNPRQFTEGEVLAISAAIKSIW